MKEIKPRISAEKDFETLNEGYCNLSNQYQALSDNYRALSKSYREELAALESNYKKLRKSNSKLLMREFLYKKTFEANREHIAELKAELAGKQDNKDDMVGKIVSFVAGVFVAGLLAVLGNN